MNDKEAIEMMLRCKSEILELRGIIERLRPRAEAYDNLVIVLRLLPNHGIGNRAIAADILWTIDKRVSELQRPPAPPDPNPDALPMGAGVSL